MKISRIVNKLWIPYVVSCALYFIAWWLNSCLLYNILTFGIMLPIASVWMCDVIYTMVKEKRKRRN